MSENQRQSSSTAVNHLQQGVIEVLGQVTTSSNITLLVDVVTDQRRMQAIYKPEQGESPLWDFPNCLYKREVAAYELSAALGWPDIPETIVREDAPYGVGSLQRFVDADFSQHYFTLVDDQVHHPALKTLAVFDVFTNNADRKAGHCLLAEDLIFGIDNALCFNVETKLRTVIWDFGGQEVEPQLLADIDRVRSNLPAVLAELLSAEEVDALSGRMDDLLAHPVLPELVSERQYPWPLL